MRLKFPITREMVNFFHFELRAVVGNYNTWPSMASERMLAVKTCPRFPKAECMYMKLLFNFLILICKSLYLSTHNHILMDNTFEVLSDVY
jgi:hypothetical protein